MEKVSDLWKSDKCAKQLSSVIKVRKPTLNHYRQLSNIHLMMFDKQSNGRRV